MVFDASYIKWQDNDFTSYDWSDFYPEATEELELPSNEPPERGRCVQINVFIDANHAGSKSTRCSHMGFLIYLN